MIEFDCHNFEKWSWFIDTTKMLIKTEMNLYLDNFIFYTNIDFENAPITLTDSVYLQMVRKLARLEAKPRGLFGRVLNMGILKKIS
jgi:hypothetical protein